MLEKIISLCLSKGEESKEEKHKEICKNKKIMLEAILGNEDDGKAFAP
jgi:hypothetical protein